MYFNREVLGKGGFTEIIGLRIKIFDEPALTVIPQKCDVKDLPFADDKRPMTNDTSNKHPML